MDHDIMSKYIYQERDNQSSSSVVSGLNQPQAMAYEKWNYLATDYSIL